MSNDPKLQKAVNSISAGLRLLRDLDDGTTKAQEQAREAQRRKLHERLKPVVEIADAAIAECIPIRKEWSDRLSELIALRGRIKLPGVLSSGQDSAWFQIQEAQSLITNGIAGYERHVENARALLARSRVNADDLVEADYLAKLLKPIIDLPHGCRAAVGYVERLLANAADPEGFQRSAREAAARIVDEQPTMRPPDRGGDFDENVPVRNQASRQDKAEVAEGWKALR